MKLADKSPKLYPQLKLTGANVVLKDAQHTQIF